MHFADFFIRRPIFAIVLSLLIVIAGALALFQLPLSEYPQVTPPTVQVTASYPGANPQVIADTVASPLEQAINGVEGMMYMQSQMSTDGKMVLTVSFEQHINADIAQIQVQNRVSRALPRLPEEVQRQGVVTQKTSPDILMVVHLLSPDKRYPTAGELQEALDYLTSSDSWWGRDGLVVLTTAHVRLSLAAVLAATLAAVVDGCPVRIGTAAKNGTSAAPYSRASSVTGTPPDAGVPHLAPVQLPIHPEKSAWPREW